MNIQIRDVEEIVKYSDLLPLAPKEYSKVSVFNKETNEYQVKTVFRKYISYGRTPEFKYSGKSYMFNNKSTSMPSIIQKLLDWARTIDPKFNNVYVNFYKDGNDYIEPHSDCIRSLLPSSSIMILNLNEGDFNRTFTVQGKYNKEDRVDIPLLNNRIIIMSTEEQVQYRHWVAPEETTEGRISVTFRAVSALR